MPSYAEHFANVARSYDALRDEEVTDEVVGWIAAAARLTAGQALIDIGCGTAATTVGLACRFGLDVTGVDPSCEMLAVATAHRAADCRFVRGHAERLPFADDSFNRALMQTSVHLMRRSEAFPEARRVLRPDGVLAILTVDPAGVDDFWLAEWFPSYAAIDRARFPDSETLTDELRTAGFAHTATRRRTRELRFTRDRALTMLRGRFASSFAAMSDEEYEAGVERAAREMPASFAATLPMLVVTAGS